MRQTNLSLIIIIICMIASFPSQAQEKIFADYFDIPVGSAAGTKVIGKIHLERNKDVRTRPIPESYRFEIQQQTRGDYFDLTTDFDRVGRISGILYVRDGISLPSEQATYPVIVALKDGEKTLNKFTVNIKAVKQTLWSTLYERYSTEVLYNSRLFGKKKLKDSEVGATISDLESNHGRFPDVKSYTTHPKDYPGAISKHDHWLGGTIEYDWIEIANRIGQLGYAYAKSDIYGPNGEPSKHAQLRKTLIEAIIAYTNSVPVEGNDIMVDSKPIGPYTGDGTSLLKQYKWAGQQALTHQWLLTDPLVVPIIYLMPDILDGISSGDEKSQEFYDSLIRYFQIFTAIVEGRRAIDNPDERWGEIQDIKYSAGAWADANLSHRMRTMLALPIIWADYNRPMTYVPYWYEDFYGGKPFKGFSFSTGWSPHGVLSDVAYWVSKNGIPTHRYSQSGYQPDGTISHHTGHGTDAAMVAYGFEWLTGFNNGFLYFKNTPYEISGKHLQFELDRLLDIYPIMIYKGSMDYLVAGRSFLQDQSKFVDKTYSKAVKSLLKSAGKRSGLQRTDELKALLNKVKNGEFELSTTTPFWVNEYIVHRRGQENGNKPFYASLKLKSERTVGAEDFDKKTRHSWHMGSGILQLKVSGDEYSVPVISNYDWHALPGLTEEWRSDPLPLKGGSQASLPGDNKIAGVLADGQSGMAIYHHLPREKYSSAQAFKSYYFNDNTIFALGSAISRFRKGQGTEITTFVDQGSLTAPLIYCVDGSVSTVSPEMSVDITLTSSKPMWFNVEKKSYAVLPVDGEAKVRIQTGTKINITDREIKVAGKKEPGFIIAIDHGINPDNAKYAYAMLPNVPAKEMNATVKSLLKDYTFATEKTKAHAIKIGNKNIQAAFFEPCEISVGGITVRAHDVSQFMLRESSDSYILSASNPAPDDSRTSLTFTTSKILPAGVYNYTIGGIYPVEGETVIVSHEGLGSKIVVEIPDSRDEEKYNYQTILYSGAPITVIIPKKNAQ